SITANNGMTTLVDCRNISAVGDKTFICTMKKQVVLVEDNASIRELIEYILADHDIDVVSFATAGNFRNAKTAVTPDLYILDIMLPDGNGIELCKELKAEQDTQHTPVIMMSAHFDKVEDQCRSEE